MQPQESEEQRSRDLQFLCEQLRQKCEELEREIMARTSVEVPTTPDAMSVNSNQSQQWTQSSAVWDAPGYGNPMLVGPTNNWKVQRNLDIRLTLKFLQEIRTTFISAKAISFFVMLQFFRPTN